MGLFGLFSSGNKCKVCGTEITGQYVKDNKGNKYCSQSCFEKSLPTCKNCGKHMKQWIEASNGSKYCSEECFKVTLPKCSVCGKPIRNGKVNKNGDKFCSEECFEKTLPKCDHCGKTMREWIVSENGQKFCSQECYKTIWPKCSICDTSMNEWYVLDNNKFCSKECIDHIDVLNISDTLKKKVMQTLEQKEQSIASGEQISKLSEIPEREVKNILFQFAKKGELLKNETNKVTLYEKKGTNYVNHEL